MKVIKTASGKNAIKLSKKEWERIGSEMGWINKESGAFQPPVPNGPEMTLVRQIGRKFPQMANILNSPIGRRWAVEQMAALGQNPSKIGQLKRPLEQLVKLYNEQNAIPVDENANPDTVKNAVEEEVVPVEDLDFNEQAAIKG